MKRWIAPIAGLSLVACAASPGPDPLRAGGASDAVAPDGSAMIAFENVRVLTMSEAGVIDNAVVMVEDETIVSVAAMGAAAVPAEATRIDAAGKVLMPGLADMHVHYWSNAEGPLYVANSITTVRNPWGTTGSAALDARAKAGADLAPHIYYSGPLMDGPEPIWGAGSVKITSVDEAIGAVDAQRAAGFKAVKLYEGLTPDAFRAAVAAAKAAEMQVWAHTPGGMSYGEIVDLGVDSIEHFNDAEDILYPDDETMPTGRGSYFKLWAGADRGKIAALAARVAEAGVWNVPTMAVIAKRYEYLADADGFFAADTAAYVGPNLAGWWRQSAANASPYDETKRAAAAGQRAMIKALYDAGAPLAIGTDAPNPFLIPGFSMHDELAAFVAAGLPVAEVLRIATAEAARFFGEAGQWGVVAADARADLVLLDADPRDDLSALRDPAGVMVNGRWHDRAALKSALAAYRSDIARQYEDAAAASAQAEDD